MANEQLDDALRDPWAQIPSVPTPSIPGVDTGALKQRWDEYLSDPTTQGALLSFAGQAVQPRQWGQSNFGALMSAIGQGGASVRQSEQLNQKEQEAQDKSALRQSQSYAAETRADAARARAGEAGANADIARGRLALAERESELRNQRAHNRNYQHFLGHYNKYVRDTQKANQDGAVTRNFKPAPILSPLEYLAANPGLTRRLGITPEDLAMPGGTPEGGGQPDAAPTPRRQPQPGPQAAPTRPPNVPAGSAYSPSRRQWRDPSGIIYDANGQRVSS